jgi:diguanylate cyclase (GGDEF)-like protein
MTTTQTADYRRDEPPHQRPLVVLVDDQADTRLLVRVQLEAQGCDVMELENGEAVVETCRLYRPDLVLLDVQMPGLDGWQVLGGLKAEDELAGIPVVLLTVQDSTADVVKGLEMGAHDYISKPFHPAELGARVQAALRVKRLQDELNRRNALLHAASSTDALTGLPNRAQLERELQRLAAISRRHQQPLAVLMVDVDHFKQVNDTAGHNAGDVALQEVASRMGSTLRTGELAGRWGGDEFVVLLPFTDEEGARILAERIRGLIAGSPMQIDSGPPTQITISVGYASGIEDPDILLRRADAALYAAKEAGRNVVRPYERTVRANGSPAGPNGGRDLPRRL